MKRLSVILILLLWTLSSSAQTYTISTLLCDADGPLQAVQVQVFESALPIAKVKSDTAGIAFIRFTQKPAGKKRSLVLSKDGFKRYVIDISWIKKDVKMSLILKKLSDEQLSIFEQVELKKQKIDYKFATAFLQLSSEGELKTITSTSFSAGRKVNQMLQPMAKPNLKAAQANYEAEQRAKEAAFKQQQASQEAQQERREVAYEKEEAMKDREKWQKKYDSFQKQQKKIKNDRDDIRQRQRKLDRKRNKWAPDKVQSIQKNIDRDRRRLDKKQQKLDKDIKKHLKEEPK